MTHKQRMHACYRHEPFDRLPLLVNMDHWYNVNTARGTIPERYRGWPLWEIQRDLRVSIWQRVGTVRTLGGPTDVTRRTEQTDEGTTHFIETPHGPLTEHFTFAPDFTRAHYRTKWLVNSAQELRAALYTLEGQTFEAHSDDYRQALAGVGEDGIVLSSAATDPLMYLLSHWMGVKNFSYALADFPELVEEALETITRHELRRAEAAAQSECWVFQVGGNITAQVVSPRLFERWAMPFFHQVSAILHRAGKIAQYHFDGWVKPLLPMIRESHLDCIEALTPKPAGDVTWAEAIEGLGGKVLVQGGIPAAAVTHGFDDAQFDRYIKDVIRVAQTGWAALGMGDNVPPDGDLARVRRLVELVEELG